MIRSLTALLLIASTLLTGCTFSILAPGERAYTDGSMGYNAGYNIGAGLLISNKLPPVIPPYEIRAQVPDIHMMASQAESELGWYTCGNWVYDPEGRPRYPAQIRQICFTNGVYSREADQCVYITPNRPNAYTYNSSLGMPLPSDPCRKLALYKSAHDKQMEKRLHGSSGVRVDTRRW